MSTKKYKSKLEERVAKLYPNLEYEKDKFKYTDTRSYTPDWKYSDTLFYESKGYFDAEDRKKHLLIKEQHPGIEIRFIFENPNKKIHPKSKTTYGEWCTTHGIIWYSIKDLEKGEVQFEN